MKRVILVSGAPGSGKTTIAVPLAAELGLPLLSKDIIKEQLFDTLGAGDGEELSWSRRLGAASMELIWTLARHFPEAVLEANFRPHSPYERSRITQLSDRVIEVNCVCPFEVASKRYSARARSGQHHPVHVLPDLGQSFRAEYDRPVGVGAVIQVDTTNAVDVQSLGSPDSDPASVIRYASPAVIRSTGGSAAVPWGRFVTALTSQEAGLTRLACGYNQLVPYVLGERSCGNEIHRLVCSTLATKSGSISELSPIPSARAHSRPSSL